MRYSFLIFTIFILLYPAQSVGRRIDDVSEMDNTRIKNIIVMGKMIEYFHKQTGYYPMQPEELGVMSTIRITDKVAKESNNYAHYMVLQEELFDVLGEHAKLFKDPEDKRKRGSRIYKYETDGQSYWLSATLYSERPYTKREGQNAYKMVISSRPNADKHHYSIGYVERFEKSGEDNERMQKRLFEALEDNNYAWATDLLSEGANPSPMCGFNQNCQPLAWAVRDGNIEKVKFLLQNGADINGFNAYYDVALIKAINDNQIEVAKLLVASGANLNIPNRHGITPFLASILMKKDELTFMMLNDHHVNLDGRFLIKTGDSKENNVGVRPLEAAIQLENVELVKQLLEKGANPNLTTAKKDTPLLDYARSVGNEKIITLLENAK